MSQPLLELKGITRSFMAGEREFIALKGIDLSIHAGEMLAIIGASGSGKSTLMNILGGLDYATAGSYKINGIETRSLGDEQLAELRRDYFGFIFQRYHLLAHLSALHNVEMPAIYAGTRKASAIAAPANCWHAWACRGTPAIGPASCPAGNSSG